MPSPKSKYPAPAEPGANTFEWVLAAAAEMRAGRRAQVAIAKAQAEASKRPRDKEPPSTSRWKNKPSPWVARETEPAE